MSTDFVLDSSVTLTWFFEHEAGEATDEIQSQLAIDATAFVPLHWRLEVCNVLLMAERKKLKDKADTSQFVSLLNTLSIETDGQTDKRAHSQILTLAREHRLTSYDAAYLDLAISRGIPLATLDRELRAAATKLGLRLLPTSIGGA